MKEQLPCGVVRDLLPLYAENLAGAESRTEVERHLESCPACRAELEKLKAPAAEPAVPAAVPLQKVKRTIQNRRWKTAALAVCLALAAAVAVLARATTPEYLACTGGGLLVEARENGAGGVSIWLGGQYHGYRIEQNRLQTDRGDEVTEYLLWAWLYPLDLFAGGGEQCALQLDGSEPSAVYFVNPSGQAAPLWQNTAPTDMGLQVVPRLVLRYYLLLMAGLAAVLGALLLALRKRQRPRRVLFALFCAPVCYLAGHGLVKGFSALSVDAGRDFSLIVLAGAFLYAAALLAASLRRER